MTPAAPLTLDAVLDAIADRVAARLIDRVPSVQRSAGKRLLNVAEAAEYIGRSKSSVQHMITSGALPVVRSDRRVFLDRLDLDGWIDQNKQAGIR
jgi:excisionase family DNA binding protein